VSCALAAVGIIALWVFRQYYTDHAKFIYLCFAAVWVVMAAAALVCSRLSKRGGKAVGLQVFAPKTAYLTMYLTAAAVALSLVAALVLGIGAAYYIVAVLVGWLFCLAVYFTVKLM
jgi:cobalamin synthase